MSFSSDWLSQRAAFDNEARNLHVERNALQYVKDLCHIMDIGTGTGNNFAYYKEKFPQANWILVDNDAELLSVCQENSAHDAEIRELSIHEIESFDNIDLITANAIFDLFSIEQFIAFANKMCKSDAALLATLNYQSMSFSSLTAEDVKYVTLYEKHMLHKKPSGSAMGSSCTAKIADVLLNQFCYNVYIGRSDWVLDHSHNQMTQHILRFMYGALSEMDIDIVALKKWIEEKQTMFAKKTLTLHISHLDIFAHP